MIQKSKSEAGFSLIAVLVIMGVVLFSMLLISQARFRQQGTQKALKVKQSYADVNQALINVVAENFHNQMKATATGLSFDDPATLKDQKLDSGATFSYVTAIRDFDSAAPDVHKSASERCRKPSLPVPGDENKKNRFYFCVQLVKDSTATGDSILAADYAFAEFAVELIDLQTNAKITPTEYFTRREDKDASVSPPVHRDGSAGMAVTMALYWKNGNGKGKGTYSQKALSYIANQNI